MKNPGDDGNDKQLTPAATKTGPPVTSPQFIWQESLFGMKPMCGNKSLVKLSKHKNQPFVCTRHWQKSSPRSGQREIQAAAQIVWKNTSPPNWITPTSICGWQRAVSISSLAALHLISSSSHPSNSTKSKHMACERRVFVSWAKFPLATHPQTLSIPLHLSFIRDFGSNHQRLLSLLGAKRAGTNNSVALVDKWNVPAFCTTRESRLIICKVLDCWWNK